MPLGRALLDEERNSAVGASGKEGKPPLDVRVLEPGLRAMSLSLRRPAKDAEAPAGSGPPRAPRPGKLTRDASATAAKEENLYAAPSQGIDVDLDLSLDDVEEAALAEALLRVKRKRQEQLHSEDQSPGGR